MMSVGTKVSFSSNRLPLVFKVFQISPPLSLHGTTSFPTCFKNLVTYNYWLELFHQPLPSTADLEKGATPPREKQPKGLLFIKSTSLVVCAREMGTFSTSSSATKPRMAALMILSALKKP